MTQTQTTRKRYKARHNSMCYECDKGIYRGMPIVYAWHPDYRETRPIHAGCENLHNLRAR